MSALAALFNPRTWAIGALLLVLAASHWKAYHLGGAVVTAERTAEDLQRSRAALRYVETKTAQVATLEKAYVENQRRAAADAAAAGGALERLRVELAAAPAGGGATSAAGTDHGTGGLERELLGQCAGALGAMAQEADRLAGKVVALQAYVQAVRTSAP